jgi:hypothetical protein
VKRLFLAFGAASFLLAGLAFAAHAAIRLDPTLAETWVSTAGVSALLVFMLTWACALVAGAAYGLIHPDLRPHGEGSMRCLACGYILAGLPENRCPECSRPFDSGDPRSYDSGPSTHRHHGTALVAAYAWLITGGIGVIWLAASVAGFLSRL